jgi:hypothetical protein
MFYEDKKETMGHCGSTGGSGALAVVPIDPPGHGAHFGAQITPNRVRLASPRQFFPQFPIQKNKNFNRWGIQNKTKRVSEWQWHGGSGIKRSARSRRAFWHAKHLNRPTVAVARWQKAWRWQWHCTRGILGGDRVGVDLGNLLANVAEGKQGGLACCRVFKVNFIVKS